MTPKEKAEELINKFKSSESDDGYNDVRDIHAAIRCTLITINVLITEGVFTLGIYNRASFWQEVKQEIEKL